MGDNHLFERYLRDVAINDNFVCICWNERYRKSVEHTIWLSNFDHKGVKRWKRKVGMLLTGRSKEYRLALGDTDLCVMGHQDGNMFVYGSQGDLLHRQISGKICGLTGIRVFENRIYMVQSWPDYLIRAFRLDGTYLGALNGKGECLDAVWLSLQVTKGAVFVGTENTVLVFRNEF
jgi:hypothetical protein